jgi:hypothetical protein
MEMDRELELELELEKINGGGTGAGGGLNTGAGGKTSSGASGGADTGGKTSSGAGGNTGTGAGSKSASGGTDTSISGYGAGGGYPAGQPRLREVAAGEKNGLGISDVLLVGILLAVGAVLKFFVGSVINFGMKPNFIIAMYCLTILLVKPRVREALIIGLLAGAVCQVFPGQPYINMVSEPIGALAMALLAMIPIDGRKMPIKILASTFLSTLASGFSFIGVMYVAYYGGAQITPTPLAAFMAIIFGTAAINAVIVQLLYIPLKLALKK